MAGPGANIPSKNANGGKKQPVDPARLCAPVCGARRFFFSMFLFRFAALKAQAGLASTVFFAGSGAGLLADPGLTPA